LTSRSTFPPDDDEDTIELELTAEEMRRLSPPAPKTLTARGGYRVWSVPLAAALAGAAVSFALRPSPPRYIAPRIAASPTPEAAPATISPPPAPAALVQLPTSPVSQVSQVSQVRQGRRVRVTNPFDPQEVFEFPAGTTQVEARQKVSELLLQRAVDRRGQVKGTETADRRRAKDD
jgi:hypothetical protein